MSCDLHIHSTASDGSMTGAEIVAAAKQRGLSAIALTDHNTLSGLPEFLAAGAREDVRTAAGCEFTTEFDGTELHLVGLFLPRAQWPSIESRLQAFREIKHRSNDRMIERLRAHGYDVTRQEADALSDGEEINRSHVARVLLRKGYVGSVKEAFATILHPDAGFYAPGKRPSVLDMIRFLRAHGAVTVLAHPFLNLDEARLCAFLPQAVEAGLDAMETHYTEFDDAATRKAQQIAEQFGLLESGGSDFHGAGKPDIALGAGRGDLCVPDAFYEKLAALAESRRGDADAHARSDL